jgi:hypothetical protein
MTERVESRTTVATGDRVLSVRWDDSAMRTLYANACNVTGTREEIALLFGVNQAWHEEVKELVVQLQDRVLLSPFAAKRLSLLLNRVLHAYEERYGPIPIESTMQVVTADNPPHR